MIAPTAKVLGGIQEPTRDQEPIGQAPDLTRAAQKQVNPGVLDQLTLRLRGQSAQVVVGLTIAPTAVHAPMEGRPADGPMASGQIGHPACRSEIPIGSS